MARLRGGTVRWSAWLALLSLASGYSLEFVTGLARDGLGFGLLVLLGVCLADLTTHRMMTTRPTFPNPLKVRGLSETVSEIARRVDSPVTDGKAYSGVDARVSPLIAVRDQELSLSQVILENKWDRVRYLVAHCLLTDLLRRRMARLARIGFVAVLVLILGFYFAFPGGDERVWLLGVLCEFVTFAALQAEIVLKRQRMPSLIEKLVPEAEPGLDKMSIW